MTFLSGLGPIQGQKSSQQGIRKKRNTTSLLNYFFHKNKNGNTKSRFKGFHHLIFMTNQQETLSKKSPVSGNIVTQQNHI